jgi:hypothetical protein
MNNQEIARVAHEVNRAFCKSIGDHSQPVWEDAPEWQQSSAIAGVEFIKNNPTASPSASHESWLKQKTAEGWTYGETKDPVAKTHPCYVPYHDLPTEQKSKDYIFGAVVRALLPRTRATFYVNLENMTPEQAKAYLNQVKDAMS